MLLSNSERFISEYEKFKTEINQITDPQGKEKLNKLLQQLLSAVKAIDQKHMDLTTQLKMPDSNIGDTRNQISEIRKQIISNLKIYQSM
jgi:phosphoribosylformylglycinamidine (FGAM) synthase PurS component